MTDSENAFDLLRRVAQNGYAETSEVLSEIYPIADYLIAHSVDYLNSPAAQESISVDPYWPKWNSPWWHMLLLHELGFADRIPQAAVDAMLEAFESHYLHFFPFLEKDLPLGVDPLGRIACHCQLGEMEQVLAACGVDVADKVEWLHDWYCQYQLPDGGLNCDESAYIKNHSQSASSIVSTLPPLEAILATHFDWRTLEDEKFLNAGAQYLIDKRLFRSAKTGKILDERWLQICFPRFYEYDILRGLSFLLSWSVSGNKLLPASSIAEAVGILDHQFPNGIVCIERSICAGTTTRYLNNDRRTWSKSLAQGFPLLNLVGAVGSVSPVLTKNWNETKLCLKQALDGNLIV